jgi:hypothetical protein
MNGELLNMINTARATGVDLNNMTASLDRLGQGFHDLGFGVGDLVWLLGETNKEGIKTTSFVYALGTMMNQLSKEVEEGKFPNLQKAFEVNIDQIRDNLNSADATIQAVGIQRLKTLTSSSRLSNTVCCTRRNTSTSRPENSSCASRWRRRTRPRSARWSRKRPRYTTGWK